MIAVSMYHTHIFCVDPAVVHQVKMHFIGQMASSIECADTLALHKHCRFELVTSRCSDENHRESLLARVVTFEQRRRAALEVPHRARCGRILTRDLVCVVIQRSTNVPYSLDDLHGRGGQSVLLLLGQVRLFLRRFTSLG